MIYQFMTIGRGGFVRLGHIVHIGSQSQEEMSSCNVLLQVALVKCSLSNFAKGICHTVKYYTAHANDKLKFNFKKNLLEESTYRSQFKCVAKELL